MGADHFYTTDPTGELARQSGYGYEGIACYIFPYPAKNLPRGINVFEFHRWYNSQIGNHFYTTITSGEMAASSGYKHEGIAGYVWDSSFIFPIDPRSVPLYRWYNPGVHDHFYTTNPTGESAAQSGYMKEGGDYHVYKDQVTGSVPFFRWYLSAHVDSNPMPPGISGMWFYFKMENSQSEILPCFTIAQYAKDAATAKAIAEALNGGYTATPIDYGAYLAGC